MSATIEIALAFVAAAVVANAVTPLAIRIARHTNFLDRPESYKGHQSPTPYLGGAAVLIAFLAASPALGGAAGHLLPVALCAIGLWVVGTIDDRHPVPPGWRVLAEVCVACIMWRSGVRWGLWGSELLSFIVTVVWVVGLVNAFNLMDNLDGASTTVTAVSAAGIGVFALHINSTGLAVASFALCGACLGFLPHNLAGPARIFLGDGGSMTLGFLIAGLSMVAAQRPSLGSASLLAGGLLAGLPILDTTLVVVSRRRRGIPILTGGRDHVTHRLLKRVHSPRRVALTLGSIQAVLVVLAMVGAQLGEPTLVIFGCATGALGALAIIVLEFGLPVPDTYAIRRRPSTQPYPQLATRRVLRFRSTAGQNGETGAPSTEPAVSAGLELQ